MKTSQLKEYIKNEIIEILSESTEEEIENTNEKTKELTKSIEDLGKAKKEAGLIDEAEDDDDGMDDDEMDKKAAKAAKSDKSIKQPTDTKKDQFNKALKFIKKYKGEKDLVAAMLKKAKEEYKLPKNLLQDLARVAQS